VASALVCVPGTVEFCLQRSPESTNRSRGRAELAIRTSRRGITCTRQRPLLTAIRVSVLFALFRISASATLLHSTKKKTSPSPKAQILCHHLPDHKTIPAPTCRAASTTRLPSGVQATQNHHTLSGASHPRLVRQKVISLQSSLMPAVPSTSRIMRPDGSGLKQITIGHGDDHEPPHLPLTAPRRGLHPIAPSKAASIFGRRLSPPAHWQITSAEADEFGPTWSPPGAKIAFVRVIGSPENH